MLPLPEPQRRDCCALLHVIASALATRRVALYKWVGQRGVLLEFLTSACVTLIPSFLLSNGDKACGAHFSYLASVETDFLVSLECVFASADFCFSCA